MPGYLTHAMILIETEKWLGDVEESLKGRVSAGQGLSELERKVLDLAEKTRKYLRYEPSPTISDLPPAAPAVIDNGIGNGISQYAFAGSIGPDFPAASNILVLNQRWAYDTLHKGSPRRAWEKAGTTEFITKAIDSIAYVVGTVNLDRDQKFYRIGTAGEPSASLVSEFKKPMMSYIIGHLSAIATHVIVHPFVNYWVWKEDNADHRLFEIEIDAQVAKGYFQREDLHSGQNLEDYFLDDGYGIDVLMELYFRAFRDTYGTRPSETMCAFPSFDELKTRFPALEDIIKTYPELANRLNLYHGYDTLLDNFTALDKHLLEHRIDEVDGLKGLLKDYPCKSPTLNKDFLYDGYKNTTNWAIDSGYDYAPRIWFRLFWSAAILAGGILAVKAVQSTTDDFSTLTETIIPIITFTLAEFEHPDSQEVKQEKIAIWEEKGFLENPEMWLLALDKSYSRSGHIFLPFSKLMTGIPLWDGIFGQGTDGFFDVSGGKIAFNLTNIGYIIGTITLGEIAPKVAEHWLTRLLSLIAGSLFDFFGAIFIGARSEEHGVEGKVLDRELYILRLMIFPFYFLSCALVFSLKAERENDDGTRETGFSGWDLLCGLIFPGIAIGWLVWGQKVFDSRILNNVISIGWPDTSTSSISEFLPFSADPATGRNTFKENEGTEFPVRLFPNTDDIMKSLNGRRYYPQDEDETTAWIDRAKKDEEARKQKSQESAKRDYKLKQLFDRAACFSALLAMAAVNYDEVERGDKERAKRIFQDWNLDYRTIPEWNDLMESVDLTTGAVVAPRTGDAKPGLLEAASTWLKDIKDGTTSDPEVIDRLKEIFGLASTTAGGPNAGIGILLRYEDNSPMADAEFEAVFGDQRVRGRTDGTGTATINIPVENAETFRLFLLSYPERLVAGGGE